MGGSISQIDPKLPIKITGTAVAGTTGGLTMTDIVCINPSNVTVHSTYFAVTDAFILSREDGTKHDTLAIATASMHLAYDAYLDEYGNEESEEEAPPAPNMNSYYNKLRKRTEVPTIENDNFYVDTDTWYYLLRNIHKQKFTLITGPSGTGKTEVVALACKYLKKTLHTIDMSGMIDPVSGLIGVNRLNKEGSYFDFSRFSEVIQDEDAVVLLDELNRAALESANILLPVTDSRRQLYCDIASKDVPRIIEVKATIIATANIGFEYVGVSSIDRALLDRCSQIELELLSPEHETTLLIKRTGVSEFSAKQIVGILSEIRELYNKRTISTFVSTRYAIELAGLVADGWDIVEAFRIVIYPLFEGVVTETGERNTVHMIIKKTCA